MPGTFKGTGRSAAGAGAALRAQKNIAWQDM
jgi:hypothetical protein